MMDIVIVPILMNPETGEYSIKRMSGNEKEKLIFSFLRARTVIAYLAQNGLMVKTEEVADGPGLFAVPYEIWHHYRPFIIPQIMEYAKEAFREFILHHFTSTAKEEKVVGGLAVALSDSPKGFLAQPPLLFLLPSNPPRTNLEVLKGALEPSLRWLSDRPETLTTLKKAYGEKLYDLSDPDNKDLLEQHVA